LKKKNGIRVVKVIHLVEEVVLDQGLMLRGVIAFQLMGTQEM